MKYYLILVFTVFAVIITPLQFHLDWWTVFRSGETLSNAFHKALIAGTLFFYGVVLSFETFFRLETHTSLDRANVWIKVLRFACFAPVLLFIFDFLPFYYTKKELDNISCFFQLAIAGWAFLLATLVYLVLQGVEKVITDARN